MKYLRAALSRLPAPIQNIARKAYQHGFRSQLKARVALLTMRERFTGINHSPAIPPPLLRYCVSEDLSIHSFMQVGQASADNLKSLFDHADKSWTTAGEYSTSAVGADEPFGGS